MWTWPIDYDVQAFTAKRHPEWPTTPGEPGRAISSSSAWAAARRSGLIERSEKYEDFKGRVRNVEDLGQEDVDPTVPRTWGRLIDAGGDRHAHGPRSSGATNRRR